MPTVRIDHSVYELLKREAEPFIDTPNSVLRRLLGLSSGEPSDRSGAQLEGASLKKAGRVLRGFPKDRPGTGDDASSSARFLPREEYVGPLLVTLHESGGSAPISAAIEAVGKAVANRLTSSDKDAMASGGIRWKNRVQWVRFDLVERGLLSRDVPRGVWALTPQGAAMAAEFRRAPNGRKVKGYKGPGGHKIASSRGGQGKVG